MDTPTDSQLMATTANLMVLSRAYQGRCWRLAVDLGSQRVRLDWPDAPPVGEPLAFSLPPERCVVLRT